MIVEKVARMADGLVRNGGVDFARHVGPSRRGGGKAHRPSSVHRSHVPFYPMVHINLVFVDVKPVQIIRKTSSLAQARVITLPGHSLVEEYTPMNLTSLHAARLQVNARVAKCKPSSGSPPSCITQTLCRPHFLILLNSPPGGSDSCLAAILLIKQRWANCRPFSVANGVALSPNSECLRLLRPCR